MKSNTLLGNLLVGNTCWQPHRHTTQGADEPATATYAPVCSAPCHPCRTPEQVKVLKCLQQQQLILADPATAEAAIKQAATLATPWSLLQQECAPVLQQLLDYLPQKGSSQPRRHLAAQPKTTNSTAGQPNATASETIDRGPWSPAVVSALYLQELCSKGYTGPLCTTCAFPGSRNQNKAYGQTYSGCSPCPRRGAAILAYALLRLFDLAILGVILAILLVEMRRRRLHVASAATAARAGAPGQPGPASQQHQRQQPSGAAASSASAPGAAQQGMQGQKRQKRSPLFAAEVPWHGHKKAAKFRALNYSPSRLTTGQLFEVSRQPKQDVVVGQQPAAGAIQTGGLLSTHRCLFITAAAVSFAVYGRTLDDICELCCCTCCMYQCPVLGVVHTRHMSTYSCV